MAPKAKRHAALHQAPTEIAPMSKADEKKRGKQNTTKAEDIDLELVGLLVRKNPKDNSKVFWNALKALCSQKCGGAEQAFRKFSDHKDQLMSFHNFQELLDHCGMHFNPRTARFFFKQAVQEGEATLSIQVFTSVLMIARIDRIRAALQEYNASLLRTSAHIDNFVGHLAMHTGETNRRRAITRFQHKLTLAFLVELRTSIQNWTVRMRWENPEVLTVIDCECFLRIVESIHTVQGYELEFLRNVFRHVDRSGSGRVKINDLLVILMLVSAGNSRREKSGFLFVLFDLDGKGCLTHDQLLLMYCSCTIHSVIARGDRQSSEADVLFGDELSLAKARRLYDYTVERLAQRSVDEYCSFTEWWDAIGANELLLRELVPGTQSMDWVTSRPSHPAQSKSRSLCLQSPAVSPKVSDARTTSKDARATESTARPDSRLSASAADPTVSVDKPPSRQRRTRRAGGRRSSTDKHSHPLQAPGVMNAERFRMQAAIRFRHAVRGEWDDVQAMQSTQDMSTHARYGSLDRLPKLDSPAAGSSSVEYPARLSARIAGDSPNKIATEPAASHWTTEVSSFGWRQRQPNWIDRHQDTLTNWARAPRLDKGSLSVSQSLPSLRAATVAASASEMTRPPSLPAPALVPLRRSPVDMGVSVAVGRAAVQRMEDGRLGDSRQRR